MRARMLVDAKVVDADPDHPLAVYHEGQELEGPAAEKQVGLGHAVALADAAEAEEAAADVQATPEAAQHAEELGVPLEDVEGTGAGGRVLKSDVAAAAAASEPGGEEASRDNA